MRPLVVLVLACTIATVPLSAVAAGIPPITGERDEIAAKAYGRVLFVQHALEQCDARFSYELGDYVHAAWSGYEYRNADPVAGVTAWLRYSVETRAAGQAAAATALNSAYMDKAVATRDEWMRRAFGGTEVARDACRAVIDAVSSKNHDVLNEAATGPTLREFMAIDWSKASPASTPVAPTAAPASTSAPRSGVAAGTAIPPITRARVDDAVNAYAKASFIDETLRRCVTLDPEFTDAVVASWKGFEARNGNVYVAAQRWLDYTVTQYGAGDEARMKVLGEEMSARVLAGRDEWLESAYGAVSEANCRQFIRTVDNAQYDLLSGARGTTLPELAAIRWPTAP